MFDVMAVAGAARSCPFDWKDPALMAEKGNKERMEGPKTRRRHADGRRGSHRRAGPQSPLLPATVSRTRLLVRDGTP